MNLVVDSDGRAVLTHDLDFSAILAGTGAEGPSVLQVRGDDVMPEAMGEVVCEALARFDGQLGAGAIVSVDVSKARVRVLPLDTGDDR